MLTLLLAAAMLPCPVNAGYAFAGQGLSNVLSGSVPNGALSWSTAPAWLNAIPSLPSTNETAFTLPACDRIVVARLALTVWGGTADYLCRMTVAVNGTPLSLANPLAFGGTGDTNAVFTPDVPCAYGSGYGVWLVTLPVPGAYLHTDASANEVRVVQESGGGFDGRIQHLTLVVVSQSGALANTLDYAFVEGSGDLRAAPSPPQVDQRSVAFADVNPVAATGARLTVLYTYGDTGLNDGLRFNGTPLGGEDVSQWDATSLNYGPSVVSFEVLPHLAASNRVTFDVSPAVPDPRDGNLRPQLAALAVTRPAPRPVAPTLALRVHGETAQLTLVGEPGRTYTVLASADLAAWREAGTFVSTNVTSHWTVPAPRPPQFFRVRVP